MGVILRDKMFLLASFFISIGSCSVTSVDTRSISSINESDIRSCPQGWVSGHLVDMGCLLFDISSDYTWDKRDCGYVGTNQQECEQKGCCWRPVQDKVGGIPWCYYKDGVGGGDCDKDSFNWEAF